MLTFKEFLIEKRKSSDYMYNDSGERLIASEDAIKFVIVNNINSYISPHSNDRMKERDISREDLETLVKRAIKYTTENMANVLKTPEHLFFSKSLNRGIIASYRRDHPSIKKRSFFIVTILPKGSSFPKPGTDKFILEGLQNLYSCYNISLLD